MVVFSSRIKTKKIFKMYNATCLSLYHCLARSWHNEEVKKNFIQLSMTERIFHSLGGSLGLGRRQMINWVSAVIR